MHTPTTAYSSIFDREVDDLFEKYDTDGNGQIDKEEFRDVVKKMKSSSRRREILSVATATFGSLFVATESSTFAFAQKRLRSGYLEEFAEAAQDELFPTAMLSSDLDKAIAKVLKPRGFTPENTLFGHSVCADEVNNRKEQLIPLMVNRWQEGFALGGLGGLPFAGKSGFGAYLHHVPDSGKLLVIFAPHVGIDEIGRIGSLQRDGQANISSACGAAVGAYKELQKTKKTAPNPLTVLDADNPREYDPQLKNIVALLAPRLDGIEESADSIAFVTYQMYGIIRELITACIVETPDLFDFATEVAVVGGIMINRRKGGDFFQPLSFETSRKGEEPVDRFTEAFGDRPNLLPIIGSKSAMNRASLY
ncbi:hypothetical protein ACHAXR_010689 [Thalassiosira sp. AJA248-18]